MNESTVRTVDEKYVSATHASNLRCEADVPGPVDVLIAVGWCKKKLYGEMTRLFSEYDGTSHPSRMKHDAIAKVGARTMGQDAKPIGLAAAQMLADKWYVHEVNLMMSRLKTLPGIRGELTYRAMLMGIESPGNVASAVLLWMLDDVCNTCHGVVRDVAKNEASLKAIVCPACRGSGKKKVPYGEAGKDLLQYIEGVMGDARNATRKSLSRYK